jgi:hypothetical protein
MAACIVECAESGVSPEKIAVVLGAAHVAALSAGEVSPRATAPSEGCRASLTVIPYSFPRLAESRGYGAGNRAPYFYQRAHRASCSFDRAALETLLDVSRRLRARGFAASLGDCLEAYRLVRALAELRNKAAPGVDEVREAAVAVLCRGQSTSAGMVLEAALVGKRVGRVAERIGQNSLQEEFWREVRERRLPCDDEPRTFAVVLVDDVAVGTSIFLHRLRVADIPYAISMGFRDEALETALASVRETWEAQWTPATDAGLVEKITLGEELEGVVRRVLMTRLASARASSEAAHVLLEAVLTDCPRAVPAALTACDTLASGDDDLLSLAQACRSLTALVTHRSSRRFSADADNAVGALADKTFTRALGRLEAGCMGDDEAVLSAIDALRLLHEVSHTRTPTDRENWLKAAVSVAESEAVHPLAAGLATGLLYLGRQRSEEQVGNMLARRLSATYQPRSGASYLEGLLRVNATLLCKNRALVGLLDAFLTALDAEPFAQLAPLLRRAFSPLSPTERRFLLENVLALRSADALPAARALIEERDQSKLAELDTTLADLDDLI